jgi:hypothetical protein
MIVTDVPLLVATTGISFYLCSREAWTEIKTDLYAHADVARDRAFRE